MFNLVLPEITMELQLSLSQASWITSGFLLVYAIGTVMYGKLADTFRLKNLLTFGFTMFAVGSVIGLFAHVFWLVLLGRILQAVGAAVVPAAASIIPIRYFSPEKRGRAMGIAMTGLAIGSAIGPIVASLVVSILHWRWLFCMPLLILLTLPRKGGKLADVKGNAYLIVVASALLGSCFLLMSLFTGNSPLLIVLFLILGNVGQTFMMIGLSHTLSRTLPQDQTGVGMGFLSMMNFIAGAVSAGVYSRVVDQGAHTQWLPLPMNPEAYVYSNIYVVLLMIHVSILFIHYFLRRERTMKHAYTAK